MRAHQHRQAVFTSYPCKQVGDQASVLFGSTQTMPQVAQRCLPALSNVSVLNLAGTADIPYLRFPQCHALVGPCAEGRHHARLLQSLIGYLLQDSLTALKSA